VATSRRGEPPRPTFFLVTSYSFFVFVSRPFA